MRIPGPSEDRVLRNVMLGETGYRLMTWDTGRGEGGGSWLYRPLIGYAFWEPGEAEPLFAGDDYSVGCWSCIDDDASLRGLLGFLTLRRGDTDSEYFSKYSERQLAWRDASAEELSMWSMGPDDFEEGDPMPLVEVEL